MYTKDQIKGMLITLNKLYPKLPVKWANYIIAEASDLPNLGGYFIVDNYTLEVSFEKFYREDCEYYNGSCDKGKIDIIPCIGIKCGEFKLK